MWLFNWFNAVYRKLMWVVNFITAYVSPIYNKLIEIIKEVQATDMSNDDKRKTVFQRITDFIQERGLQISDSVLNTTIELVYQLVKNKVAK